MNLLNDQVYFGCQLNNANQDSKALATGLRAKRIMWETVRRGSHYRCRMWGQRPKNWSTPWWHIGTGSTIEEAFLDAYFNMQTSVLEVL